jgi:hypothetical protein
MGSQGPTVELYQEGGTTANGVRYVEMLQDRLRPADRTERRGKVTKGVATVHENDLSLTDVHTVDILRQLNFRGAAASSV